MNDEEQISNWDSSYALENSDHLWGESHVPYLDNILSEYFTKNNTNILEIPSGDGRNTIKLSGFFETVIACDTSQNALNILKQRISRYRLDNVVVLSENIYDLSFADGYLENVLCWDLLSHLRDPKGAIEILVRKTSIGGIIIGSLLSVGDSTFSEQHNHLEDNVIMYNNKLYYKYYELEQIESMFKTVSNVSVENIVKVSWLEGAHEGFREYEHTHESYVFVLKKR